MRPHPTFLALGTAAALLLPARAPAAPSYAFVACTDFGSGCASWVETAPPRTGHGCVETISSDPVCRWAFGKVFVVNRFGFDNVQVLDPGNAFLTEMQYSIGNGTNPQDIAVVSPTKAYVSRLASPDLLIVHPMTGAELGTISLAAFADGDGSPEPFKMFVYGDRLFVTLQRLDNFVPVSPAYVVAIDLATDTVLDADPIAVGTQAIALTGTNPNTDFALDRNSGLLLVGETGAFGVQDGGVEAIDPIALTALGFEATEAQLGGDLNDLALAPNGRAYVVVNDDAFNTLLLEYDRETGAVADTVYAPGGFSLGDVEVSTAGELWVCDRTFADPGVRVFETATNTSLAGPISTGQPPFDIAFDEFQSVAVSPPPSPGLRVLFAGPNPVRDRFEVRFAAGDEPAQAATLRVYDVRGTEVGRTTAAGSAVRWNAAGTPPGAYFFRLVRGGESVTGRFVRLR